jgi:hypothetical protein
MRSGGRGAGRLLEAQGKGREGKDRSQLFFVSVCASS